MKKEDKVGAGPQKMEVKLSNNMQGSQIQSDVVLIEPSSLPLLLCQFMQKICSKMQLLKSVIVSASAAGGCIVNFLCVYCSCGPSRPESDPCGVFLAYSGLCRL